MLVNPKKEDVMNVNLRRIECCYNCGHKETGNSKLCKKHEKKVARVDMVCDDYELNRQREVRGELERAMSEVLATLSTGNILTVDGFEIGRDRTSKNGFVKCWRSYDGVRGESYKMTVMSFVNEILSHMVEGGIEIDFGSDEFYDKIEEALGKIDEWVSRL